MPRPKKSPAAGLGDNSGTAGNSGLRDVISRIEARKARFGCLSGRAPARINICSYVNLC
jgi:hypothetical protein